MKIIFRKFRLTELIICILFIFQFSKTIAQTPWVPVNATWYYQYGVMGPGIFFNKWVCTKDTIVLGKNCSYIELMQGNYVTGDFFNFNMMYEDSNIVYWYNAYQNSFSILYNFNAQANDSWITSGDSCDFLVAVDSVSSQIINGDTLKVLFISSDPDVEWGGKVIQKIGNTWRPTPNFMTYCYGWIEDLHYYTGLRCYSDDSLGFYETGIAPSCDTVINSVEEVYMNENLSLYPNPINDKLFIKSKVGTLKTNFYSIQNSLGKIVQTGIINSDFINTENLIPGIYFLKIKMKNQNAFGRFVKINTE